MKRFTGLDPGNLTFAQLGRKIAEADYLRELEIGVFTAAIDRAFGGNEGE